MTTSTLLYILSLFTVLLISPTLSVTINLPKYGQFCLFRDLKANETFGGSYVVSGYNSDKVNLKVMKATEVLTSLEKQKEGNWEIMAQKEGEYKACFKNTAKQESLVSVEFAEAEEQNAVNKTLTTQNIVEVNSMLNQAFARIRKVRTNLGFQKTRGNTHGKNLDSLNVQLQWSAFFKILTLAVIAVSQVYVLTGYFKKQRKLFV